MITLSTYRVIFLCFCTLLIALSNVQAATISFSGQLDYVELNAGGAVYSGVAIGNDFEGEIDDETANGFIYDGNTETLFGCCIAAGGLSINNDMQLTEQEAIYLNEILGSEQYSVGDIVDTVNIEGDTITDSGGRIEIGISYILPSNTFDNADLSNYPVDHNKIILSLFFIYEEDVTGVDIYSAGGRITTSSENGSDEDGNETGNPTDDNSGGNGGGGGGGCFIRSLISN